MNVPSIFSGLLSDSMLNAALTILAIAFVLGMFLQPYQSLPTRVDRLEQSDLQMRSKLLEQERKLDLVICFLETEANGGNPLSCSR